MRDVALQPGRRGAAQALAVADQYAAPVILMGFFDQLIDITPRFLDRSLMQVQLSGDLVTAFAAY